MAAKSMALAKLLEKRMMFQDFLSQRHDAHASRVDRAIARPGPPQIRTCAIDASGSSTISFAIR